MGLTDHLAGLGESRAAQRLIGKRIRHRHCGFRRAPELPAREKAPSRAQSRNQDHVSPFFSFEGIASKREGKLNLFVAIDRTSKFAFVQLVEKANRVTASAFLVALVEAVPYKIRLAL
jgi:hypothetical protein